MRSSGFPYGRHERKRVSPDSENIEPAKPSGLKAKLFERGGNPRQRERAEGGGAFFVRSIASEKKVRRPVKSERPRQSHPGQTKKVGLKCYKYLYVVILLKHKICYT